MPTISGTLINNGIPANGVVVSLYKASRLSGVPTSTTAPPAGAADATSGATGTQLGPGAWEAVVPTTEDYYAYATVGGFGTWMFYPAVQSPLTLTAQSAAQTPLTLKAAVGQATDLLDISNSAGTNLLSVGQTGTLSLTPSSISSVPLQLLAASGQNSYMINVLTSGAGGMFSVSSFGEVTATLQRATGTALTLQAAAAQSADIVDVLTNAGTKVVSVNSAGGLSVVAGATTSVPLTVKAIAGQTGDLLDVSSATGTGDLLSLSSNGTLLVNGSLQSRGNFNLQPNGTNNGLTINQNLSGLPPTILPVGSDANIDILLQPKGTGTIAFATIPTGTTSPTAGGAGALPATPAGYATLRINGTLRQVAYY